MMIFPLFATKLNTPILRMDLLERPRLITQLTEGLSCRVTLVSAPAGFGKTTLLSQWIHTLQNSKDVELKTGWLSLDQRDNELVQFLIYLIKALKPIMLDESLKEISDTLAGLLHNTEIELADAVIQQWLSELSQSSTPFLLVLDDYHLITSADVHQFLDLLLSSLPRTLHLVISSRTDPPIPLARLRANRELSEFRETHLRFTENEAHTFLHQSIGPNLSDEQLTIIQQETEGWIAGLQMVTLTNQTQLDETVYRKGDSVANPLERHRFIMDYLMEQVLAPQTKELREFLVETSILEQMNGSLCNAVTGRSDGQTTLEQLERANLFIIPLDNQRIWYRYHHLFSDFLRYRVEQLPQNQVNRLHFQAATWLEKHQHYEQALYHWLSMGDLDQGDRMIQKIAPRLLSQSELFRVQSFIGKFPTEAFDRFPWLSIYRAWAYTNELSVSVEQFLLQAEHAIVYQDQCGLDPQEKKDIQGDIATIRALRVGNSGDGDRALALSKQAALLVKEEKQQVYGSAIFSQALGHLMKGDLDSAIDICQESSLMLERGGNLGGSSRGLAYCADLYSIQGKLQEAAKKYIDAEFIGAESDDLNRPTPGTSKAFTGHGKLLFEWNQLEKAFEYLKLGCMMSKQWGPSEYVSSLVALVAAYCNIGQLPEAWDSFRKAKEVAQHCKLLYLVESQYEASQIRLMALSEDYAGALREAERRQLLKEENLDIVREIEGMSLAFAYYKMEDFESALSLSEKLAQAMDSNGRYGRLIETLALCAVCMKQLGQNVAALNLLEKSLILAHPGSYTRTFVIFGKPMPRLLSMLRPKDTAIQKYASDLIDFLLIETPQDTGSPIGKKLADEFGTPRMLLEPLTSRESQVLHLIAQGLSNQEIANQLCISVNTVKSHAAKIYDKLCVKSRTQATDRARTWGLI